MGARRVPVTTKAKSAPRRRTTADAEQRLRTAADALGASERRLERSPVLGPRAERTRRLIIDSAWELFRTRGYTGTTVADIAKNAKVSLATFYQYFSELNDVLAVIVVDFIKDSLERGLDRWDVRAGRDGLRQMIDKSMASYIDNRDFMELWETATLVSPRIRSLSLDYARVYRSRFEGFIREGVELGLVRADVDPAGMADAMTTMLVRYCFEHFVLSDERVPADRSAMVELLTEMWADAIKLVDTAAPKARAKR